MRLFPAKYRTDFICTACRKFFALYQPKGRVRPYCPTCGDNLPVERYAYVKHGTITGRMAPWTSSELKQLKDLMQQPLPWSRISTQLGRSVGACKQQGKKLGLKRTYDVRKDKVPV